MPIPIFQAYHPHLSGTALVFFQLLLPALHTLLQPLALSHLKPRLSESQPQTQKLNDDALPPPTTGLKPLKTEPHQSRPGLPDQPFPTDHASRIEHALQLEHLHVQGHDLMLPVLVRMRERRTEGPRQVLLQPQQLPLLLLCLAGGGATCGRRS